jgi:hypothetical protein
MTLQPEMDRTSSVKQAAFALLLVTGLYFPTSFNGEHSVPSVRIAFALLFSLLAYLAWKDGIRLEVLTSVSLPIILVLVGCTLFALLSRPVQFDPGLFIKFSALALVFALDLRRCRFGAVVSRVFVVANVLNILGGLAILAGSEWISEFLPRYYWISHDGLVSSMMSLHKPVLTFGTHSLAALYLYLFFWLNWEHHRLRRSKLGLFFALGYFILLVGLTSFTSLGLGLLALAQIAVWCWKRNRQLVTVLILCLVAAMLFVARDTAAQIDRIREFPEFAEAAFLNSDLNGPLSRYGAGGELQGEMAYLFSHPFSPIGLAMSESTFDVGSAEHFYVGDSGPLEYLVRGSVPLLLLIYFGLYRFLKNNLASRSQATLLFLVIMAFESGFSALSSSRTYFLLPFCVIYLNGIYLARRAGPESIHIPVHG